MASLTDRERELVALGASIGAGCELCIQYHVGAGLKAGLTSDEVSRVIGEAQVVRREGGMAVSNVGRRMLAVEQEQAERFSEPGEREQALVYIGAAAGCNAGSLLTGYIATAVERLGLSGEDLRSALEMAETVKQHAAEFLRRDVGRALKETGVTAPAGSTSPQTCCGPGCGSQEA